MTNLTDEEKINYVMNYVLLLYWVIKFIGELILHDIFKKFQPSSSTTSSQYNWLYQLIINLNAGNAEISQPSSSTTSSQYNWLYQLIINLNAGNADNFNHWLSIAIKAQFWNNIKFFKRKINHYGIIKLVSADKNYLLISLVKN